MPGAGSLATAAMNLNIYDAMVSTRNLKLKIDIVETLFLDEFGDPAVWYLSAMFTPEDNLSKAHTATAPTYGPFTFRPPTERDCGRVQRPL